MLFENMYMHDKYRVEIDHPTSIDYAKTILDEKKESIPAVQHRQSLQFLSKLKKPEDLVNQVSGVVMARKISFGGKKRPSEQGPEQKLRFRNSQLARSMEKPTRQGLGGALFAKFENDVDNDIGKLTVNKAQG
jgi:hypothetical protein